ncbi:hypothetical protein Patl1_29969 [Pistacia atlantica]|uniref:Uncharacterized protein n=1 Tax=Pistacia atlantica TaxID=434234 RepID=A0ACC1ABK7_9ROSI|nr:hypothetical protein Patl1_29969 [Pistacia atlantica]
MMSDLNENLVEKDFDITKVAGGVLGRAVQREYSVENYMEIHLFWAGKGTCCIPDIGRYGPSILAINATPGSINSNFFFVLFPLFN